METGSHQTASSSSQSLEGMRQDIELRLPVLVDLEDTEDSGFVLSGLKARKDRTAKNRIVLLSSDSFCYP